MDNNNITLSVVMPAYNEEQHIKDNLLETSRILSRFLHRYEIIAVNDGSRQTYCRGSRNGFSYCRYRI